MQTNDSPCQRGNESLGSTKFREFLVAKKLLAFWWNCSHQMWYKSLNTLHIQSMIIVHLFNVTTDCSAVLSTFQNIMKLKIQLYHLWNPLNATKICWPFTYYLIVHFLHSFLWKLMPNSCVYEYYHYIIIRSNYFKTPLLLSPLMNFDAIYTTAFYSRCDINDNGREECIINSYYTENHVSCSALLLCGLLYGLCSIW